MNASRQMLSLLWLPAVVILVGCSNNGGNPISPSENDSDFNSAIQIDDPAFPDTWGIWDVSIDTQTWEISAVPIRGAEFTANITNFLQPPMGSSSNLGITVTDSSTFPTTGKVTLDVSLTHPFPSKPGFTGFDVMGIFMHNGATPSQVDGNARWSDRTTDAVLLNADSYTRWMNQKEFTSPGILGFTPGSRGSSGAFTATLNPFKYFADGLTKLNVVEHYFAIPTNVINRGLFKAGSTNTREYQLQFPMPGGSPLLTFQYGVVVRWEAPTPNPPIFIPGDFPANANAPEAFYLYIADSGSTLNYHPSVGGSGIMDIDIEIFDWQGATNPGGFAAEIGAVYVEGSNVGLIPGGYMDILPIATVKPSPCNNSITLNVVIPNCNPSVSGNEWIMITVESSSPTNYSSGFGSPYPTGAMLAGYMTIPVPVGNIANSAPSAPTPTGPAYIWDNESVILMCAATDPDPGDALTFNWSIVPTGNPPVFSIPGDLPQPGTNRLSMIIGTSTGYPPGTYDVACKVQDSSGLANDTAYSLVPLVETVYIPPYAGPPPPSQWDQPIVQGGPPSFQGPMACPWFWDSFYGPVMAMPLVHADIAILSGPSLGTAGVMVIADEMGLLTGMPVPPMGFATYTCPFVSGNAPSWVWQTPGHWLMGPPGPALVPGAVHFDASSNSEYLMTSSNPIVGSKIPLVPDPSVFQHYLVPATPAVWSNDLYTMLSFTGFFDIAADTSNGFDMGSIANPATPNMYGLYTQEQSGLLGNCLATPWVPMAPNPVNFLMFPSGAIQPPGLPVDAGGPGSVAPLNPPLVSVGPGNGPGIFNIGPGGPSPSGNLQFPEPYYALGVDDDPSDNPWSTGLPLPVTNWTLLATIDSNRDLEIYEADFGVPTPAPILPWSQVPFGGFMGGMPNLYPVDCEFISNFSGFGGTTSKPAHSEDLLAVLLTDTIGGIVYVEIFSVTPGIPTSLSVSAPLPIPPMNFGIPGVAFSLDVDEVTGDIYVAHESASGSGSLGVTIFSY